MLEVAVPIASCEQSTLETAPMRKLPGASNKRKPEKVVLKYVVVQLGCGNVVRLATAMYGVRFLEVAIFFITPCTCVMVQIVLNRTISYNFFFQ